MLHSFLISTKSITSYLSTNLVCLMYGPQLLISKSSLLASYVDLLADLAEVFGVWVALSLLIITMLLTSIIVKQVVSFTGGVLRSSKADSAKDATLATITYRKLTKSRTFFVLK